MKQMTTSNLLLPSTVCWPHSWSSSIAIPVIPIYLSLLPPSPHAIRFFFVSQLSLQTRSGLFSVASSSSNATRNPTLSISTRSSLPSAETPIHKPPMAGRCLESDSLIRQTSHLSRGSSRAPASPPISPSSSLDRQPPRRVNL